jgi:hypothetical protein
MLEQPDPASGSEKRSAKHVVWGITVVIAFLSVFGTFVQLLWNWLMPSIFGLRNVTYLEAIGLLLLSRLLFGRMGQRRDHSGYLTGKYGFRSLIGRDRSQENSTTEVHTN